MLGALFELNFLQLLRNSIPRGPKLALGLFGPVKKFKKNQEDN
jgi:hypothetical protein